MNVDQLRLTATSAKKLLELRAVYHIIETGEINLEAPEKTDGFISDTTWDAAIKAARDVISDDIAKDFERQREALEKAGITDLPTLEDE